MKRRSRTSERPEPTYFIDRDLGKRFTAKLRDAQFKVECLSDHFAPDTPDTVWIPSVSKQGWVILTKDKRIGLNDNEIELLIESGARCFVPPGQMNFLDFGELVIKSRQKMAAFVYRNDKQRFGAYMAKLKPGKNARKPGKIEIWQDREKWEARKKKRR